MRFEIGQQVWRAQCARGGRTEECPDCGGTGRIRVIFHDNTEVSIGCEGCTKSFGAPSGRVDVYDWYADVQLGFVTGFRVSGGKTEWEVAPNYIVQDEDLFATEAEAIARAEVRASEIAADEKHRISLKEKPTRSWAWNASYHRSEIKRCRQSIEHHTAKLAVADLKAKAEKKGTADA